MLIFRGVQSPPVREFWGGGFGGVGRIRPIKCHPLLSFQHPEACQGVRQQNCQFDGRIFGTALMSESIYVYE